VAVRDTLNFFPPLEGWLQAELRKADIRSHGIQLTTDLLIPEPKGNQKLFISEAPKSRSTSTNTT